MIGKRTCRRIFILLCTVVIVCVDASYIYRSDSKRDALFLLVRPKTLVSSPNVISLTVDFIGECVRECVSKANCTGFSFKRTSADGGNNCKLSGKLVNEDRNYVEESSWDFYGMVQNTMCDRFDNCNRFKEYVGSKLGFGGCNCLPLSVVSRRKTTNQASTDFSGISSRAVDGNKNSDFNKHSCTHTLDHDFAWWRVDLGAKYYVASVTITNRGDCCYERFSNIEIRIGMSLFNNGNSNPLCTKPGLSLGNGETREFFCDSDVLFGRFVNIKRNEYGQLTLCEVEVLGILV